MDFGHLHADRAGGEYADGTLTGYRDGRRVRPVPDGSCDLTAHVAFDACAAAGVTAGASRTRLLTQREALGELVVPEPTGLRDRLEHRSQLAELVDPNGLGAFNWLIQSVRLDEPGGAESSAHLGRLLDDQSLDDVQPGHQGRRVGG